MYFHMTKRTHVATYPGFKQLLLLHNHPHSICPCTFWYCTQQRRWGWRQEQHRSQSWSTSIGGRRAQSCWSRSSASKRVLSLWSSWMSCYGGDTLRSGYRASHRLYVVSGQHLKICEVLWFTLAMDNNPFFYAPKQTPVMMLVFVEGLVVSHVCSSGSK